MTPDQERALIEAADEFHRVTCREWGHRHEWQRLGGVLNEVAPRGFDRVTGDPAPAEIVGDPAMLSPMSPNWPLLKERKS